MSLFNSIGGEAVKKVFLEMLDEDGQLGVGEDKRLLRSIKRSRVMREDR